MARAPAAAEIEELPEADRLTGFPHPRMTARLYGHEAAERGLAEAFSSRMHHAWLLTGPQGIGKATLAYRVATFLLARPDERDMFGTSLDIPADASASRQVRALSHPGLLVDPPSLRHEGEDAIERKSRSTKCAASSRFWD